MEYWSVEKKNQSVRHYSNTPKLIDIESFRDGLLSFGL